MGMMQIRLLGVFLFFFGLLYFLGTFKATKNDKFPRN